ncbi:SAM-dependent methyltransferase [Marinilabiliaceae bacterium ANBcel2]|nr:SAM-dependent methyltransferase [Marinilabiliaceae bacterium ANBcel2]
MKGTLYLIPNTLGAEHYSDVIPQKTVSTAVNLKHFIVEDLKNARRFLKKMDRNFDIDSCKFYVLNKRTDDKEISNSLRALYKGEDIGVISEAGCPGVADPGAEVVKRVHGDNIKVVPLTGPSSILLALMASGLNGQNFAFNGYLPINKSKRADSLKQLEQLSKNNGQSQIFIEAPYRNNQMLETVMDVCSLKTKLCIACNITTSSEFISTRSIKRWKEELPDIHKQPAIFIIQG